MNSVEFPFAGYMIVKRLDVLMVTPEELSYRGVDRERLSAFYRNPDATLPTDWRAAICTKLLNAEDPFELIVHPAAAEGVFAEVLAHDSSYELLACGIEDRLVQDLFAKDAAEFLPAPDQSERIAFDVARRRLAMRTPAPPGMILGYDVAYFGFGFWSVVFRQVMGTTIPPFADYRGRLNQHGLFPAPDVALAFRDAYVSLPDPEIGNFYVYEIRQPVLSTSPLKGSVSLN
jgi:hypothetical protein